MPLGSKALNTEFRHEIMHRRRAYELKSVAGTNDNQMMSYVVEYYLKYLRL